MVQPRAGEVQSVLIPASGSCSRTETEVIAPTFSSAQVVRPSRVPLNIQTQSGCNAWGDMIVQLTLCAAYVTNDVTKIILFGVAVKHRKTEDMIVNQSVETVSSTASFAIGIAISFYFHGWLGVEKVFNRDMLRKFFIPSALFSIGQAMSALAIGILGSSMVKIVGQAKLLDIAILSYLFLGRRYSMARWLCLLIVVLSGAMFIITQEESKTLQDTELCITTLMHAVETLTANSSKTRSTVRHNIEHDIQMCNAMQENEYGKNMAIGLLALVMWFFANDSANLVTEYLLKGTQQPYYQQLACAEFWCAIFNFLMSFVIPALQYYLGIATYRSQLWWDVGFFNNWTFYPTGLAVVLGIVHSWFAGLMVKMLSAVMKMLSKTAATGTVYVINNCLLGNGLCRIGGWTTTMISMLGALTFLILGDSERLSSVPKAVAGGSRT